MLIGIDASRANRSHKSGTEWYSYYLIRHLARLDGKNRYILYTDQPLVGGLADLTARKFFRQPELDRVNRNGYQKVKSPHGNFCAKVLRWPYSSFWTLGRLSLECLLRKPDVLFVPSHTMPFFAPRRSVVTIHDVGFAIKKGLYRSEPIGPENKKERRLVNLMARAFTFGRYGAETTDYLRWSAEHSLKKARRVITVSQCSKKDILDNFHVSPAKISVIYNGYNRELFHDSLSASRVDEVLDKYGVAKPYFFYAGKIEKKKNIPALIEAFAQFKDRCRDLPHKLVLVGDAFYGYDEVHFLIREFNLDNDVIMPGWIDEEDMPMLYKAADAFVYPSNYEAFGISLLEAMAAGVPIAASNVASFPEVLGGAGLLFDPDSIDEMSCALERIATDFGLRERLVKAGSERIKDFSWEKCAEETLNIINSL